MSLSKSALLLSLGYCLAGSAAALTEDEYAAKFYAWAQQHGEDANDRAKFSNFKASYDHVAAHNALYESGASSYFLATNKFAGMSQAEFQAKYLGGLRPSRESTRPEYQYAGSGNSTAPPAAWDWRSKGLVTPVKDQGQCGSCWAFSAVATMEGRYNQDQQQALGGAAKLTQFSEQEVVDCTLKGADTCDLGGEMHDGIQEIAKNHGGKINTEQQYPYTSGNGKSKGQCNAKDGSAVDAQITGYTQVKSGDEDALLQATYEKPVISVGIDASSFDFQLYSGGVYNEKSCKSKMNQLDHGVAVVGYGTKAKKGKKAKKSQDYWIVKNSWNTDWGMNGYILMSRNKNNQCGIATDATFALSKSSPK